MHINGEKQIVEIEGIVTACNWNEQGGVTGLKICSDRETDYLVAVDYIGNRLINHIGKKVTLKGWIEASLKGIDRVHIIDFTLNNF